MVAGLIIRLASWVLWLLLLIVKKLVLIPLLTGKHILKLPFYFVRSLPRRIFCFVTTTVKVAFLLTALGFAAYHYEEIAAVVCPNPPKSAVFPFESRHWTVKEPSGNTDIKPFSVAVPDGVLEDLQRRLSNTRYGPSIVQDVSFGHGFPPDQLKNVVNYWKTKFSWRKQEALLNQYPQFKTEIEGLNIHFVHVKPKVSADVRVLPIILLHGFPGSFFELYKLVPLLTSSRTFKTNSSSDPRINIAFEVIIPSLPGYGFSDAPQISGLETGDIARIMNQLMVRLGHSGYIVHGGDWGSMVARSMAVMYPRNVKGMELTMYRIPSGASMAKGLLGLVAEKFPNIPGIDKVIDPTESDKIIWKNLGRWMSFTGYLHFQATKPDTVGAAVVDSPAGLAAYILDLFAVATDPEYPKRADGGLTEFFTMDDLLTNVMIYWVTDSFMSAARLYKEFDFTSERREAYVVTVPTVLSDFPNEPRGGNPPLAFIKPYFRTLVDFRRHDKCGHFAGMECPQELADDIWSLIPHFAAKPLAKKPAKSEL